MTSPSLFINRLVVDGQLHGDFSFKHGLNILHARDTSGDPKKTNKSGKTALVELIKHGLGKSQKSKDEYHFNPIIDKIKTLWLEVEANGQTFTIERSLQNIFSDAKIHDGVYVPGMSIDNPDTVPIDQMSPFLLNALGIPQVSVRQKKGDLTPLSFQLLMQAFILHQEDSFGAILGKLEPTTRRTDVIGFLTGIVPIERYTLEDEISSVQLELKGKENSFTSIQDFLIKNGVPTLIEAEAQVTEIENALGSLRNTQLIIQEEIKNQSSKEVPAGDGQIDNWRRQILHLKDDAAKIEQNIAGMQKELGRLSEILSSLRTDRNKYQKIQASTQILSTVEFSICPRCLLEITPEMRLREENTRCSLCNRPLRTTSDRPPRVLLKPKDIDQQIAETEELIKDIKKEIDVSQVELAKMREQEGEIGSAIERESRVYISPSFDRLLAQAHGISQKEAELAYARGLLAQAKALSALQKEIFELRKKLAALEDKFRDAKQTKKAKLENLREIYQSILTNIEFPDFRDCTIDSRTFMPYINGSLYIHTGTAFKGLASACYYLSMFSLAKEESTLFPKILVIDSPAVGDLNEESHDRLLKYLASLQTESITQQEGLDWQIILTTRRSIPEFKPYTFMEISAPDHMLLAK